MSYYGTEMQVVQHLTLEHHKIFYKEKILTLFVKKTETVVHSEQITCLKAQKFHQISSRLSFELGPPLG